MVCLCMHVFFVSHHAQAGTQEDAVKRSVCNPVHGKMLREGECNLAVGRCCEGLRLWGRKQQSQQGLGKQGFRGSGHGAPGCVGVRC